MSAQILPFRKRRARGSEALASPIWDMDKIRLAMQRDLLVCGFLELRDVHLPRMGRVDRQVLRELDHFLLHGGLSEDHRSIEHNLAVVQRLLTRYRRPKSTFHRIGQLIHQWLWEVTEP